METIVHNKVKQMVDVDKLKDIARKNREILSIGDFMIARYREELSINNDYRGRQLLELIQNADDEGSKFISILLDTNSNILKISNEGSPFTTEGFRSLLIPNLSSKRKRKYIGNKGLGFRSILNWSNKVTIYSGGVEVSFSRELAKKSFFELHPVEDLRTTLLKEFGYPPHAIPFPTFAIPQIEKANTKQQNTTIEINYINTLDIIEDIKEQILSLKEDVLLFLNNIDVLTLSIEGNIITFKRSVNGRDITINDKTWRIYDNKINDLDPELPREYCNADTDEPEVYSLKIAVSDGLKDTGKNLFSFFPTKINMNFPMIIHGTFELDSSRNRIIDTPKNQFLISQLVDLIFLVSDDFFPGVASWDKMRLFNYGSNRNAVLDEDFSFYDIIDEQILKLSIFPTLDGNYTSFEDIKFINNNFPQVLIDLAIDRYFPKHLLPVPEDLKDYIKKRFPDYDRKKTYSDTNLRSSIEGASREIVSKGTEGHNYARWILALGGIFTSKIPPLSILYNDNCQIIEGTDTIYTPRTKTAFLQIPPHVSIQYLNDVLSEKLYYAYNIHNDDNRSRKLKDRLDNFVNIQSFEPAPVLSKIITSTNASIAVANSSQEKQQLVRETIKILYDYYIGSSRAIGSQLRTENISITALNGEIVYARDSFLNARYPTGQLRVSLLGNIYSEKEQVADPETLGLENTPLTEEFLTNFLGINKFVKIEPKALSTDTNYREFVFRTKGRVDYRDLNIFGSRIMNIATIRKNVSDKKISAENLVAWICSDSGIYTMLASTTDTKFHYSKSGQSIGTYQHVIPDTPSYVKFQLQDLGVFSDYLLNDLDVPFLNDLKFDFYHECFTSRNIAESTIKNCIVLLGAKQEFRDLELIRIERILHSLKDNDPNGRYARRVYQAAIDKYDRDKALLNNYSGLQLHAVKNGIKQYLPYNDVYYSGKIGLPRKVLSDNGILNFPRRAAEQNIHKFLRVKNFENIDYNVESYKINELTTAILQAYLKDIKPYILAIRLQKVNTDVKGIINLIKSIQIKLCDDLKYQSADVTPETYDFIREQKDNSNQFLVLYPGSKSKEDIIGDSELSDVISEIFAIAFDVISIEDEVRNIFVTSVKDTEHQIKKKYGEEALAEARGKLQISEAEELFWKNIYELKAIENIFPPLNDEKKFRDSISSTLGIDKALIWKFDYDSPGSVANLNSLVALLKSVSIDLATFNLKFKCQISLSNYHLNQIAGVLEQKKENFINGLWMRLKDCGKEEQRTFLSKIVDFTEDRFLQVAEKHRYKLIDDYESIINEDVRISILVNIDDFGGIQVYKSTYEGNIKAIGINGDQLRQISSEEKSTFYFEIDKDELERLRDKFKQELVPSQVPAAVIPPSNTGTQSPLPITLKPINNLPPGKNIPINKTNGYRKNRHFRGTGYSNNDEQIKRELGKRCEYEVFAALKQQYLEENVEWVSENSDYYADKGDHWGYDIKYRQDIDSTWIYIEVKSFHNDNFYLSVNEYQTALEKRDCYYIFLVDDIQILRVPFSELLDENGKLLLINKYFSITVNDYRFYKVS